MYNPWLPNSPVRWKKPSLRQRCKKRKLIYSTSFHYKQNNLFSHWETEANSNVTGKTEPRNSHLQRSWWTCKWWLKMTFDPMSLYGLFRLELGLELLLGFLGSLSASRTKSDVLRNSDEPASGPKSQTKNWPLTLSPCMGAPGLGLGLELGFMGSQCTKGLKFDAGVSWGILMKLQVVPCV